MRGLCCRCSPRLTCGVQTARVCAGRPWQKAGWCGESAADAQFANQIAVALLALVTHIGQQSLAATDHLEQTLTGGEVVDVLLQVAAELRDALGQHGHLNLSRTGIGGVGLVRVDQLLLLSGIERHARRLALTVQTTNLPPRLPLCR